MKRLIEFPLEDSEGSDDYIVVEVDESELEPIVELAARDPGQVAKRARQTFETALERIKPAAGAIIAKLRGLGDPPDEVSVEFGLKMTAQAGAVVAAAGAEANYTITLKWRGKPKDDYVT